MVRVKIVRGQFAVLFEGVVGDWVNTKSPPIPKLSRGENTRSKQGLNLATDEIRPCSLPGIATRD